ncbi:ankyrin repeat domain-containing protein 53 [Sminthopsis crassicaudata]|uniref:ankyrin repeat domain-containing protein 53 n=1 Tax=Sminthopsis crassicaudata TaxID=9301 RepID=UPI003D68931D
MNSEAEDNSSWGWLAPSLWASQWTEKTHAHLAYHPCSVWTSACPLCKGQGPEWARVVQEPPFSIQVQPADPSGKKVFQTSSPTWRSIDWDDPWGLSNRRGKSLIHSAKKRALAQKPELLAAAVGNLEWLHQCLKYQRDIRSDRRGYTALHLAAEHCNLDCMTVLVEQYRFPLDMKSAKGWTPLHLTINKSDPNASLECVRYLLKAGASANVQNQSGITPLHLASEQGMLDCIKFLVEAGADVHIMDNRKRKGIDLCKMWNHRDCARYLKDAMWKQDKKEMAEEMYHLNQLKKKLLIMQKKYLLKKKKEKEAQHNVAFVKWLQTKPLPKLPEIKILEPAKVRKESVEVKEAFPRGRKEPPRLRKELGRIRKELPAVPKEAPHVKKPSQTPKPQPPRRPQPPCRRGFPGTPRDRRRFRLLKRIKPILTAGSSPTFRPSESTAENQPAPSGSRPSSSPPALGSPRPSSIPAAPGSPRPSSSPPILSEPSTSIPPAAAPFSASSQLSSSKSRVPPTPSSQPSSQQRPVSTRTPSYAFLRSLCEAPPEAGQPGPMWSTGARLPRVPMSLLDLYLADIPRKPPPARPPSPFNWRVKWNPSTQPTSRPVTQIAFPQGVRLGVQPDPPIRYNFRGFLKFFPDGEGGVHIQTADGDWIFPVPRLPFKVLWRELCQPPKPERLAGPEGPKHFSAHDLPVRRYVCEKYLWSGFMAMSLRETFDAAFLALVQRHRAFPPASPSSSPPSSSSSVVALRQCLALLFSEPPR